MTDAILTGPVTTDVVRASCETLLRQRIQGKTYWGERVGFLILLELVNQTMRHGRVVPEHIRTVLDVFDLHTFLTLSGAKSPFIRVSFTESGTPTFSFTYVATDDGYSCYDRLFPQVILILCSAVPDPTLLHEFSTALLSAIRLDAM